MNRRIGVMLILICLLAGIFTGCSPDGGKLPFFKHPQGGLSKTEPSTDTDIPVGPATSPSTTAPSATATPTQPIIPVLPGITFTTADAALASQNTTNPSVSAKRPDLTDLVLRRLDWDLSGAEPTVLIIHTHGTESYNEHASSNWRTQDKGANMIALGDKLVQLLTQAGISVLHDRSLHDYPSYNDAYDNSRKSVEDYLQAYPSIQVVLDLHRDAVALGDGSQWAPTVTVDGQKVAKLMMVVGTNEYASEPHDWQENMAMALKLQVLLEKQVSGITRSTMLKKSRYNQDLSSGAVIVEIGTAGNTFEQAMGTVPYLANALIQLMHGANNT